MNKLIVSFLAASSLLILGQCVSNEKAGQGSLQEVQGVVTAVRGNQTLIQEDSGKVVEAWSSRLQTINVGDRVKARINNKGTHPSLLNIQVLPTNPTTVTLQIPASRKKDAVVELPNKTCYLPLKPEQYADSQIPNNPATINLDAKTCEAFSIKMEKVDWWFRVWSAAGWILKILIMYWLAVEFIKYVSCSSSRGY